ncbi:MAG: hypothetical protein ACMXYL_02980 [Candidatus Woesearchaeota archaeon]
MRKGASATGPAAATVILTGLIIVLYLLFLPPAERDALLGNASPITTTDPTVIDPHDRLLQVFPRIIEPIEQRSHNIPLASLVLHTRGEDRELATFSNVDLMSSRTDKRLLSRDISFEARYTYSREMIVLDVEEANAPIIVYWNDQKVYHSKPRIGTLIITNFGIIERNNRIRIEVEDPKWYQFFRTNTALINRVQVNAVQYDDIDSRAEQTFVLSRDQSELIESSSIRYYASCQERPGQLLIRVNNELLQSQAPVCNMDVQIQIDPAMLREGRNTITYSLGSGVLHIDSPTVYFTLERPLEPLYYFEINDDQWKDIRDKKKKGFFEMVFVRGTGQKDIDVIINGRIVRIDTREDRFLREITEYLVQGENYIKLQPRRRAEAVALNVFLRAAN